MTYSFPRQITSLEQIFMALTEFVSANQIDQKAAFSLQLAIEEVFTNLVKYNKTTLAEIRIDMEKQGQEVIIRLQDFDVEDFDVSKPPNVDPGAPLEKRRVGGLGLFLVHQVMNRVDYHYEDRTSTITLVKRLSEDLC